MNDLEKAKALVGDKNTSLKDLADKCKLSSYSTLRHDRTDLKKMSKSTWRRIHELAKIYDKGVLRR